MTERPLAMTDALLALDYRTDAVREIAIVWPTGTGLKAAAPLLEVLRRNVCAQPGGRGGGGGRDDRGAE